MSVSQARYSKIKDHPDFSQGSISPQSFLQVCCFPGLSIAHEVEQKDHSPTMVTHGIEVKGNIPDC